MLDKVDDDNEKVTVTVHSVLLCPIAVTAFMVPVLML